MAITSVIDWSY